MSNYHIYYKNQLGGSPIATIPAVSPDDAIKQYRNERPYPIRRDAIVASKVLRS